MLPGCPRLLERDARTPRGKAKLAVIEPTKNGGFNDDLMGINGDLMGINGDSMGFNTCLMGFHDYLMVTSW